MSTVLDYREMTDPPANPSPPTPQPPSTPPTQPTSTDTFLKVAGVIAAIVGAIAGLFKASQWAGWIVMYLAATGITLYFGVKEKDPKKQIWYGMLLGLLIFILLFALLIALNWPVSNQ
jgi:hypothetical protein